MSVACLCCGGRLRPEGPKGVNFARLVEKEPGPRADAWREGRRAGWSGKFSFLRCEVCGFVRVEPAPDEAILRRFYAAYHRNGGYLAKNGRKVLRARRRIAGFAGKAPGGRFLDIGCNAGFAVEAARQMGFQATGIDLDPEAISAAYELFPEGHFRVGTVETLSGETERFDAIFCADVIEHLADPAAFVGALHDIAAPEAVIYIATPDIGHWRVPRPFWRWEEVRPPEHLCWFTKSALAALLRSAGFGQIRTRLRVKPGLRMTAIKR